MSDVILNINIIVFSSRERYEELSFFSNVTVLHNYLILMLKLFELSIINNEINVEKSYLNYWFRIIGLKVFFS